MKKHLVRGVMLGALILGLSAHMVRADDLFLDTDPDAPAKAEAAPLPVAPVAPVAKAAPVKAPAASAKPVDIKQAHQKALPVPEDVQERFALIDRNNDGLVTFNEFYSSWSQIYSPHPSPRLISMQFGMLDSNKDGVITLQEFNANNGHALIDNYMMRWVPNGARDSDE